MNPTLINRKPFPLPRFIRYDGDMRAPGKHIFVFTLLEGSAAHGATFALDEAAANTASVSAKAEEKRHEFSAPMAPLERKKK